MRTLLGYEMKKIVMKKSTIVAFVLLFALQLLLAFARGFGSRYVNDVFYETHREYYQIKRENGMEGIGAAIQVALAPWYSYPLSMGQVFLISMGLLFLSSILSAVFAMFLAEVLKNGIGAMAVVVGLLFAARLIQIPPSFGGLSQAWNYLPINLLKINEGFLDLRLVNLFGLQLTSWQFAPILYVVIIAALVFAGGKVYKNYQVSGR